VQDRQLVEFVEQVVHGTSQTVQVDPEVKYPWEHSKQVADVHYRQLVVQAVQVFPDR